MSHERIIATVLYISDRSDSLEGGSIAFKRAYTLSEAALCFAKQVKRDIGDLNKYFTPE